MAKLMSMEALQQLRNEVKGKIGLREKGDHVEQMIVIRVAMATCGIAAGAREIMLYLADEIASQNIPNVVLTQSGCMGYCYAEPTIEVTLPGKEPVVYGHVTKERAKEILEKHVKAGEMIDGIIPVAHKSLEE